MEIASKFKNVKVLVIGDVMLDRYWWGDVTRISPEAPVPVVRLNEATLAPGGAANVAANVASLGGVPILLGCIGTDAEGDELSSVVSTSGISAVDLVRVPSRRTTVKTRLLAHGQQIARVDQESTAPMAAEDQERLFAGFAGRLTGADAIVLSDYAKGCLSEELVTRVIASAKEHQIPIIVDPKGRDYLRYRDSTILTPNRHEAAVACNIDDTGKAVVEIAGERLLNELDLKAVLITEGADGMTLFERGNDPRHLSAMAHEVYDSTGAGDTVIAALAVSLGAGIELFRAAAIANAAAGLVVEKLGTATTRIDELAAVLATDTYYAVQ